MNDLWQILIIWLIICLVIYIRADPRKQEQTFLNFNLDFLKL